MNELEQLIYDFLNKNTLMTMLDTDEARGYTEEKAKELALIMKKHFDPDKCAGNGGVKMFFTPPGFDKQWYDGGFCESQHLKGTNGRPDTGAGAEGTKGLPE